MRSHDSFFNPVRDASNANTTSTTTKTATSIGVKSDTFKDEQARPNNVEEWLLQRQSQLREFGNIIVDFTVSGNSSRHVGDLVQFVVPTSIPSDDPQTSSVNVGHQLYSGLYLISKIRHKITRNEYNMDVQLIKNSFAKRLPGQETEEVVE